jgi:heparan-sulfate lyase
MFAQNQEEAKALFENINLDYKGLEKVKYAVDNEDYELASSELLNYFRSREDIRHPDVNLNDSKSLHQPSKQEKEMAEKGMNHHFFVHKGYGYFDYGKEINWQHWPVKDNEVRWQLHRMYWWIPMGKSYKTTGNEKIAQEWIYQLRDWINDNPQGLSKDNDRFAWRQLETARRVQDQTNLFNYFLPSPHFTPDFLIEFLSNYHVHAIRVHSAYSKRGNHRLFEAQRMILAGGFFPEFKEAKTWRDKGIKVLLEEIKKQVFDDGYQFELSPNYHIASINIFLRAYYTAQLCGIANEFPQWFKDKVEDMVMAAINASFPNGVYPMFGDAKLMSPRVMSRNYQEWSKVFPDNAILQYFATEGQQGTPPVFLSKSLNNCGFYTFRNGWDKDATVMIMKAGPSGYFHCQPDNGTFELWYKGVNLMPDAGCYVYSGNEEIQKMRNWYRQTRVHQTLTLNNEDITLGAKQLYWNTKGVHDIAVYENPSYPNLKHRRTVIFAQRKFFVIIDEAIGEATGTIDLHFQVKEGKAKYDYKNNQLVTDYNSNKNVLIQSSSNQKMTMKREDGKVSYSYRKEKERPAIAFQQTKDNGESIKYVTVVYPFEGNEQPVIKAKLIKNKIKVKVNKELIQLSLPDIKGKN